MEKKDGFSSRSFQLGGLSSGVYYCPLKCPFVVVNNRVTIFVLSGVYYKSISVSSSGHLKHGVQVSMADCVHSQ